ncbi:Choline O-acetyltransferase [Echinococcus granulosus]|uniref:Choline O-acetyltransferase n=1 Tax=Echinococcus granulosus TaxID=6210 RepID=A0A068WSD5_ECHGR|nr:Choline O-acetyltransferase [Echinococcus granulosus]CDS23060.1 choline O acetyltransferase [Echinococcus granulosus]
MSRNVREFVRRISLKDLDQYPEWDLSKPLPKLPVPELRTTLTRYLGVVAPIVDEETFKRTRRLVHEFIRSGGEGDKLQAELKAYAKTQVNWAFSWWLEDMYLKNPLPLPLNSNPAMVFPRHQFISARQQLRFAAQLISGILDYKTILDARSLPIDRVSHNRKGQPLCMEQYYRLFTSYRYPGAEKDKLVTRDLSEVAEDAHAVVACHDQFFKLDLLSQDCRLGEEEIYNQLRRVVRESSANKEKVPRIGALTALPRPRWAEVYKHLDQDPVNAQNLEDIEKSMFILCLDVSPVPVIESLDEADLTEEDGEEYGSETNPKSEHRNDVFLVEQMLHGQGSKLNGANRWYDKTMQFIISRDGNCGLNYEHSVAEGVAVIRLIEYILKYMQEVKRWQFTRHTSICALPEPTKLKWNVDETTNAAIDEALAEVDRLTEDLELCVMRFNKYGRDFPKTVNMSPDSFIQLALQLTHFKMHGYLVATYESASTRRFQLGRVDNIRASSVPALKWCRAMTEELGTNTLDDRIRLLRAAMDWQTEVMLETILGYGVDIHLLGLQQTALMLGKLMPSIFEDPTYKKANWFRLSTSQVPTTMDTFMCYGAVVPDGYGAAYNPHPNNIVAVISCWKSDPNTNATRFAELLEESLVEMHDLVLSNPELAMQKSPEPNQWTIPEEITGVLDN